jgi:hypothetical protein
MARDVVEISPSPGVQGINERIIFDRIYRIDRIDNFLPQRTHRTHRKEIYPDEGNKAFRS